MRAVFQLRGWGQWGGSKRGGREGVLVEFLGSAVS